MRILAIETVGVTGSVAALDDERTLGAASLDPKMRSAQSLAPAIETLLRQCHWRPKDVQLVAVAVGPGSFTGLRIGVATAKTLAYAIGCPVVGVDTLAAIAWRAPVGIARVHVALDAGRGELFVGVFSRDRSGAMNCEETTRLAHADRWLKELREGDVVTGPAVDALASFLPAGVVTIDAELRAPTAEAVGRLGLVMHRAGRFDDPMRLVPRYHRRTAAEEQWDKRSVR